MYTEGLDAQFQTIRGGFGQSYGQTFDVYRVSGSTNDAIVSGTPALSAYQAVLERVTRRDDLQNVIFDALAYEAIGDNTALQIGDVLVQRATAKRAAETYTLAYTRELEKTIVVRTDASVTISRPGSDAGMAANEPQTAVAVALTSPYGARYEEDDLVLTLKSGAFGFTTDRTQTAAQVPCGIEPLNRVRDGQKPDLPMEAFRDHFILFLPILGSVALRTLDMINTPSGDNYRVALAYSSAPVGLVGNIAICEKLPSSNT